MILICIYRKYTAVLHFQFIHTQKNGHFKTQIKLIFQKRKMKEEKMPSHIFAD